MVTDALLLFGMLLFDNADNNTNVNQEELRRADYCYQYNQQYCNRSLQNQKSPYLTPEQEEKIRRYEDFMRQRKGNIVKHTEGFNQDDYINSIVNDR